MTTFRMSQNNNNKNTTQQIQFMQIHIWSQNINVQEIVHLQIQFNLQQKVIQLHYNLTIRKTYSCALSHTYIHVSNEDII